MNGPTYFEIQAEDLARASHFYQEIFGWKFTKAPGEPTGLPIEYWRIETGTTVGMASNGMRGGLLKRPTQTPPPQYGTNAYVCSFQVEDFDKIAEQIVRQGGKIALAKFAVPATCWQGYFIDTEGNTFGLYQPDPEAR